MRTSGICPATLLMLSIVGATAADPDVADKEAVFSKLDRNSDGVVRPDEIDESQKAAFERLLRRGDGDGNGELTREEYDTALASFEPAEPSPGAIAPPDRPPFDPQRLFERADRNGDGKLTRDELPEPLKARLGPLFERLNRDELTPEDLRAIRDRFAAGRGLFPGGGPGREDPARRPGPPSRDPRDADGPPPILRLLDTNHDGRLSREELAVLVVKFDQIDRNGDGLLDLTEVSELLGERPRPPRGDRPEGPPRPGRPDGPPRPDRPGFPRPPFQGPEVERFFNNLDHDKDGLISKEELPPPLQQRFERLDRDGDGKLSLDELREMRARQRPDPPTRPESE